MSLIRPYDVALSPKALAEVRERRRYPTGLLHPVSVTWRGEREIMHYPWSKLLIGDFFFVPLLGRSVEKLAIRFRQAAAKLDWEITCVSVPDPQGVPSLRICLTIVGVSEVRAKADLEHGITNNYAAPFVPKPRKIRDPKIPKLKAKRPSKPDPVVPTFAWEKEPEIGVDLTLRPGYDRDKVIRDRLAALGVAS